MKKFNILVILFSSLLFSIPREMYGQKKVNRLVEKIYNSKLDFEIAKVGTAKLVDSGVISLPRNLVFVKSVNVRSFSNREKQKLINSLIPMMSDTTKDWYANVLLYQLTERDATPLILIENRGDWVKKNKGSDVEYWNNLVVK